jgi:hypothetical protein
LKHDLAESEPNQDKRLTSVLYAQIRRSTERIGTRRHNLAKSDHRSFDPICASLYEREHFPDGAKTMKSKIQVAVAILVIVGVAYWAFTSVRSLKYSGSSIMFPVGSGSAVVTNLGSEPIPIEMRGEGRATLFRIASPELGLAESAKRQGSGRDAYYALTFDLPPGQARIDVTRGSGVQLISRADTPIEAVVTPVAASTVRWILIFAGAVIAYALYYISRVTQHGWLTALRNRAAGTRLPSTEPNSV